MNLLEAAVVLCEELKKSPALRIVFSFRDGTSMLVGKSAGVELDKCPVRAYPSVDAPEVIELEGIPCDQAGNPLLDAKKAQRFMLAELLTGFDLLEADPVSLARVQKALGGQCADRAAARPPAAHEPAAEKSVSHEPFHMLETEAGKPAKRVEIQLAQEEEVSLQGEEEKKNEASPK